MNIKILPEIDEEKYKDLNKYSDVLAHLLYYRGLKDNNTANEFINVDFDKSTHDPFLMKDMSIAVDRILKSISNANPNKKEKICIYSDYDADGIPGAVILSDFFQKIGFENFFVYIPHRNIEGFGLNNNAIEKISAIKDDSFAKSSNQKDADNNIGGATLLITIDCGISDVKQVQYANKLGMDVIITDHHDPNDHKSTAVAIINPHQKDCNYPNKNLCGAGVVFKLVQALLKKMRQSPEKITTDIARRVDEIPYGWEKWLLDMVGIATLSDMVPLTGENRALAKYGLLVLRKSPRKGLVRLLRETRTDQKKLSEEDIGFTISPRINAASRMDSPEIAFKMLSTDSDIVADETVRHLHKINDERKARVASIVKEIKKNISSDDPNPIIVKGNPKWQPSLMGLAASSIVDAYNKPVFLWGQGDGHGYKGSCRSDGSVNLVHLMNAVPKGVIHDFGGHEMAGGFEVSNEGILILPEKLKDAYEEVSNESFEKEIIIDRKLKLSDVTWDLFNNIEKLAPFGVGNPRPIFLFESVQIEEVTWFGKEKNHLKLSFYKNQNTVLNNYNNGLINKNNFGSNITNDKKISAIKFFARDDKKFAKMQSSDRIDLIASIEKSDFGRIRELRLRIFK